MKTTRGMISTPTVVNAAGVFAKVVAGWIGIDIPTINALRHTLITEPTILVSEDLPLIEILNPEEIYIWRTTGQVKYSIGREKTDGFAHVANLQRLVEKYGEDVIYRTPDIANLGIMHCYAGIRSLTPDGLPILGPVDTVEGYINDCGWGGEGVSHAPAGGQLVANCVMGMSNSMLSIEPFLLKRFNSEAAQKSAALS